MKRSPLASAIASLVLLFSLVLFSMSDEVDALNNKQRSLQSDTMVERSKGLDRKNIISRKTGRNKVTGTVWSVVVPLLSISFLSWVVKNGKRCCAYDEEAVLDDVVYCEFATNTPTAENNDDSEDIELKSIIPTERYLTNKMSGDDPVGKLSILDCSCMSGGDISHGLDNSFSWMGQDLVDANYLNLEE